MRSPWCTIGCTTFDEARGSRGLGCADEACVEVESVCHSRVLQKQMFFIGWSRYVKHESAVVGLRCREADEPNKSSLCSCPLFVDGQLRSSSRIEIRLRTIWFIS